MRANLKAIVLVLALYLAAAWTGVGNGLAAEMNHSRLVHPGADGRLVYVPDDMGNVIPDFSNAGYLGGGVAIPHVPVRLTLEPSEGSSDDTARIQAAIEEVSGMPLSEDGFRGALLLKRGAYRVAGSLRINASGVVLRGEGQDDDGTVLQATGNKQRILIRLAGEGSWQAVKDTKRCMTSDHVPVGAREFDVDSTDGLRVGQTIIVQRPSTKEWIHTLGMDNIVKSHPRVVQWQPGKYDLRFDRVITKIEGRRMTVDASLGNAFEKEYGGGWIYCYEFPGRIERVGVEQLRGVSEFDAKVIDKDRKDEPADEKHAWDFIRLDALQDAWVREVTSVHFGNSCVVVGSLAKWVTVQDCRCLDPVSQVRGGRRYPFTLGGQLTLVQRCCARRARHDFAMSARVPGPNAFVDCLAVNSYSDSGPHHRWAVATLYDNVTVEGHGLNVQDRQSSGTGHGWAGAQMVFWNCRADSIICQKPPTSQNYCIGCIGQKSSGRWPREDGHWESHGKPVSPRSLYWKQLEDRLGIEATRAVALPAQLEGPITDILRARLAG